MFILSILIVILLIGDRQPKMSGFFFPNPSQFSFIDVGTSGFVYMFALDRGMYLKTIKSHLSMADSSDGRASDCGSKAPWFKPS